MKVGKLKEVLVENKIKKSNKFFGRIEDLTPVILNKCQ